MNLITTIPGKILAEGITGHYAHGSAITFGLVELVAGSNVPAHSHEQEQVTYILHGQLDMIIGGSPCSLTAGMYLVIPGGTVHSAIAITDCTLIDAFSPVREDYKSTGQVTWNKNNE